jgi:hypothetical protein
MRPRRLFGKYVLVVGGLVSAALLASGALGIYFSYEENKRRTDFFRLMRHVPAVTELSYVDATGREQVRVSRLAMDVIGQGADFSHDPGSCHRGPAGHTSARCISGRNRSRT